MVCVDCGFPSLAESVSSSSPSQTSLSGPLLVILVSSKEVCALAKRRVISICTPGAESVCTSAPGRLQACMVKATFLPFWYTVRRSKWVAIKLMYSSVSSAGPGKLPMVAGPSGSRCPCHAPKSKNGLKRWWSSPSKSCIACGAPLRLITFLKSSAVSAWAEKLSSRAQASGVRVVMIFTVLISLFTSRNIASGKPGRSGLRRRFSCRSGCPRRSRTVRRRIRTRCRTA